MEQQHWWGDFPFQLGQTRLWHIAGSELTVTRLEQEWQFRLIRPPLASEDNHLWRLDDHAQVLDDATASLQRHIFRNTSTQLEVRPALADRPVVIQPVSPVLVPPGEEALLFVSTPVWLVFQVPGQKAPLLDLPAVRPKDTWFGPNTASGDLCYATKVFGRISLDELTPRPFRAVTPVRIRNESDQPMPLDKLAIPMPYLPLYANDSGRLWTPLLAVTRESGRAPTRTRVERQAPSMAGAATLLHPARRELADSHLVRVLNDLFD